MLRRTPRRGRRALPALTATALLTLGGGTAAAAVSVAQDATTITIQGTANRDATVVGDDGANVVVSEATAGPGCTQSGSSAVCPRADRRIVASLDKGDDDFENRSAAEADVTAGDGADLLIGRLRVADGGAGVDLLRPSGMTGVVTLKDGEFHDLGADTQASDVIVGDTPAFQTVVDYLSRPAQAGGVTVSADGVANDGAVGESDNIGTARVIRGTVAADRITGSSDNLDHLDGDLGADAIDGGDDAPNPVAGSIFGAGDAVMFEFDSLVPYTRPASERRTSGVTADLEAGTSSDGDTLTRIDDLGGSRLDDVIRGSNGVDLLSGDGGSDTVVGRGDRDEISCSPRTRLIPLVSMLSNFRQSAPVAFDVLRACRLTADGGDGDDVLRGGTDDDVLAGGPGADSLSDQGGTDTVSFAGDPSGVTLDLRDQGAHPEIDAGTVFENVIGSPFADVVVANEAPNVIDLGAGNDQVSYTGRASAVRIDLAAGTAAEDRVLAVERATGGSGGDVLVGTSAGNALSGGPGDDTLLGDLGADTMNGGEGTDTVDFDHLPAGGAGIAHTLNGPASANTEGDQTIDVENARGSDGNDVLRGTGGANVLSGDDGNDILAPNLGADRLTGGAGFDTLDYRDVPVPVNAHLGLRRVKKFLAPAPTDILGDELERVFGTAKADVLQGGPGATRLEGRGGDDVLDGGRGDDELRGEDGDDRFGRVLGTATVEDSAAATDVGTANLDGRDTVLAGLGSDDINVRDGQLDTRVDCGGGGTDVVQQDLVDDDGNLDIDGCDTIQTIAVDQVMTVVAKVRRARGNTTVTLSCPRASKVACNGTARLARTAAGRGAGKAVRYRIRRGRRATVRLTGGGRHLLLAERDQRGDIRRHVGRL